MADNMLRWLQGHNSRAVDLLDRNHSLSAFIAKLCYGFESYCQEHNLNPYKAEIGTAIINREGKIIAPIQGGKY